MKNYVSDNFTQEFMNQMTKDNIYLVGSECGSGKTTAIMKKLVPYAKEENKKVLYLCNRKSLKKQLDYKYKIMKLYDEIIEKNLNLTLKMYQSINEIMEMGLIEELIGSDYDYIVIDEAHLLYDASDYDFKTHHFIKYINNHTNDSIIIALSGTPNSVLKLAEYFDREIIFVRQVNKENNKIRRILLTLNKQEFREVTFDYLAENYKMLCLISNGDHLLEAKRTYRNKNIATLMSDSNPKAKYFMNQNDEYILENIISEEKMLCDLIVTTKFLDVGVNIQTHGNFLVSYYCNEQINTIEQFRSRLRFSNDSPYHLDMLFKVMTKKSSLDRMKKIKAYLQRYEELYEIYNSFEEVLKNNPKQKFKIGFEQDVEDYEQYNPITKKLKEEQLLFYKKLYESEDLLETYKEILKEMYPHVEIVSIQSVRVEKFLNDLLC